MPVDVVGGGTRSRRGRPGPRADRELRTTGLRRVIAHEPADLTLTVEAGIAGHRGGADRRDRRAVLAPGRHPPGVDPGRRAGRRGERARAPARGAGARLAAGGGGRDRRRPPGEGRGPDREGGLRLRHPPPRRGLARHARRHRPGHHQALADPAGARLVRGRGPPRRAPRGGGAPAGGAGAPDGRAAVGRAGRGGADRAPGGRRPARGLRPAGRPAPGAGGRRDGGGGRVAAAPGRPGRGPRGARARLRGADGRGDLRGRRRERRRRRRASARRRPPWAVTPW